MRLTYKDGAATSFVAAAGALFAWHLTAPDTAFVGSARWTSVVVLVLGLVACASGGQLTGDSGYQRFMSAMAALQFLLMLGVLVTANDGVLATLVAVLVVMWLVTTVRHGLLLGTAPATSETPLPMARELQHH
jgi:Ca2+/Na+ antiporter